MIRIARALGRLVNVRIERLEFRLVDVKDEQGILWRLRIAFEHLAVYQRLALASPVFTDFSKCTPLRDRQLMFLAKNLVASGFQEPLSVWRSLYLVHVCEWKLHALGMPVSGSVLFLERFPWVGALGTYAAGRGLVVMVVWPWHRTISQLLQLARYSGVAFRRIFALFNRRYSPTVSSSVAAVASDVPAAVQPLPLRPVSSGRSTPRVAVPYYGQFNLDRPDLYSDLFFWQQSQLPATSVLMLFSLPQDPLDDRKLSELSRHGFDALALHVQAAVSPAAKVHSELGLQRRAWNLIRTTVSAIQGGEKAWLKGQLLDYARQREYWQRLFDTHNVKAFTSWYKYDANHLPMAEALSGLGGVMTVYQRAYESHPSSELTLGVDVMFGFSRAGAEVERRSNSAIPYYVVTGYLGDHRFNLLRAEARKTRTALQARGARYILAFFDENTVDDSRWYTGHELIRDDYTFLLEKVLADPAFGLLLKPKVPRTLRKRLGPVAELLARAEATGRCYVFETGVLHGSFPPAIAAMAADIAVHQELWAATAGLEAALAGAPTLLLDRDGWSSSPLYRLGEGGRTGGVVFHDMPSLWTACAEHWARPGGVPGLGDWSSLLDELDPFRDGRAAERMGTYLNWLIEGFRAGLPRETVLADAAERYGVAWGRDKVIEIRPAVSYRQ